MFPAPLSIDLSPFLYVIWGEIKKIINRWSTQVEKRSPMSSIFQLMASDIHDTSSLFVLKSRHFSTTFQTLQVILHLLLHPSLPYRSSPLPIIVSVSMLITFLSNEWVGQEVKWLWAVCVSLYVCAYMCKSYLWAASSSCVHSQHRFMSLFISCTVFLCSDDALLSSSVAKCVSFWQLMYKKDILLMCLRPFTLAATTTKPSHLSLFLSLSTDNGWSIQLNHQENIKLFRENCASGNHSQKTTLIFSFLSRPSFLKKKKPSVNKERKRQEIFNWWCIL